MKLLALQCVIWEEESRTCPIRLLELEKKGSRPGIKKWKPEIIFQNQTNSVQYLGDHLFSIPMVRALAHEPSPRTAVSCRNEITLVPLLDTLLWRQLTRGILGNPNQITRR
ncbi:hypothetical protein TIFTF001_014465 [Ficus carica]|uniref:Uncharacterized protein n=1 Tax=Ficus carica TaxID=3494 RepID=A0AA88AJR1_FICCA|nr:hypothetical protein TIFTF001_014465 [Ficus carica]